MADIFAMVDTWNNGATTFAAIKMNVTDTASAAGSLLMDLQVGGVTKAKITKAGGATLSAPLLIADGTVGTPAFAFASRTDVGFWLDTATTSEMCFGRTGGFGGRLNSGGIVITSGGAVAFTITDTQGSAADTLIWRDGPGIIAQRNSTNAQAFRTYTSFTNGTNYERFGVNTAAGITTLAAESAGTGSVNIDLALSPLGTGRIKVANGMTANGTVATAMSSVGPTGSSTTVQEWLAIKNAAGTVRYIPCF